MGAFDHFPYTNFHELNLQWILKALDEIQVTMKQFVSLNTIKYADPIQWNITSQYEKNTIVIDPQTGTAYISVQPVPEGVIITNTDYWTVVFDLGNFVVKMAQNLCTIYEPDTTLTATVPSNYNDWLIWNDILYRNINPGGIIAGDTYIEGSNIEAFTIEDVVGHIQDLNTTDKNNLVAAINEVLQTLIDTCGDLNDLNTTDKTNLVAAINEVLNNLITYIDNTNIANVKDYGAAGNGVADDTTAINAAITTGKTVYFPAGSYLMSSLPANNNNFIGSGIIVYNSHNIPVKMAQTISLYDTDFASYNALMAWANNLKCEVLNITFNNVLAAFKAGDDLPTHANTEIHLYPTNTVTYVEVDQGTIYLHDPVWNESNTVAHLYVHLGSAAHVVGTDTVYHKTNNFHYWVRDNSRLYLIDLTTTVNAGCVFEYYTYAETGAVVTSYNYSWTGSTGLCWGSCFTQNAIGEIPDVQSWKDFITYFPTSWSDTPNVNSRDYMLPFCNVGSVVGTIPDYGWYPMFGTSGLDITGQTYFQADDMPEIYTMLTITGTNILNSGYMHIQVRRLLENNWDASLGDYEGIDFQVPATPFSLPTAGASLVNPKVTVEGVDYPVTFDSISGGSVSVDALGFRTNNSVSACYTIPGNNPIDFQICFIQYQGMDRPQYIGYISDGSGTKHYFNGVLKNYGRIASARVVFTDTCTQGNVNVVLNR